MSTETSSKPAKDGDLSEIKSNIMRLSTMISNQETDAKNICIKLDSITKELHQLLTSDSLSKLDNEGKKYVNSLCVRTKELDKCVDQLAEVLARIDKRMSEIPKDFCVSPIEPPHEISAEIDSPAPIEIEDHTNNIPITEPNRKNISKPPQKLSYSSSKIFTTLPQGNGMREVRQNIGFLESFFEACEKTGISFRALVFENVLRRLTKTYAKGPGLSRSVQGVYVSVTIKDYLVSFSSSFHESPHKVKLAKLTLMGIYEDWKKGKPMILPIVQESSKSSSLATPSKKDLRPKPIAPRKPIKERVMVSKSASKAPSEPKQKIVRAPKERIIKPSVPHQPTIVRPNMIADAPQSNILKQVYLHPSDLNGTYHDNYHSKFYEFFQKKLKATGSGYSTSINNAIDEFLTLFYRLHQELIALADQKVIYRNEVNSFENTFLFLLKKKGRTYEEVRAELSKYDYSKFKFRITPCFKRR